MPEYRPIEKGIVIREVINPKPLSKFPDADKRDMHLRYTVKQMLQEGYYDMSFIDSKTVIKYELVPEEGFDNLYDAYLAWWNREYLPSQGVATSNLTFKILEVKTYDGLPLIPALLSAYTRDTFKGPLNEPTKVAGLDWYVIFELREAGMHEPIYHTLEDAYRAYKNRMDFLGPATSIPNFYKLNSNNEKEKPMQFTISKKQIEKRIKELEELRSEQIAEIEIDLNNKRAALANDRFISGTIIGVEVLPQISTHIDYLKSLTVADSITCSPEEKDFIFESFTIQTTTAEVSAA